MLEDRTWIAGPYYTTCDPYAFFFYDLGMRIKLPMQELDAFSTFAKRMLERPAVRKVRELEEDVLKGSNAWHGNYYAQPRRP